MMTFGEAVGWAYSVGYQLERLPSGLQVYEPVFFFRCTRCDYYLEEVTRFWSPDGVPEGMLVIPPLTIWNLGLHMGEHMGAQKANPRSKGERRLTSVEIAREVSDIKTRPWPHASVLPMKNLYTSDGGCIFRTPKAIVPEVTLRQSRSERRKVYSSLEAMVEDGWVVD